MPLIWRDQFSVCNNIIDADHKYLIDVINECEAALNAKNRAKLAVAFAHLNRYSQDHFQLEEMIAAAVNYERLPNLHDSHVTLLRDLDRIKEEIDAMGEQWPADLVEHFGGLLRKWLIDHVINEDLQMKSALQTRSALFDPRSSHKAPTQ
jgi:hemerythrin